MIPIAHARARCARVIVAPRQASRGSARIGTSLSIPLSAFSDAAKANRLKHDTMGRDANATHPGEGAGRKHYGLFGAFGLIFFAMENYRRENQTKMR